jgi:catechol 2,3-dioxygenase-like lactoylglutathione lyase family enzyme
MIKPIALSATHMECCSLKDSVPVLTDLLAFEKIAESPGEATLKHPNTDWMLVVHEAGPDAPAKQMHNHWGVRVQSNEEVDAAFEYLSANKEKYGIKQIGKPLYNHGSYSLYFVEPGTNGWEIECYAAALRKESMAERFGGVRAPHWTQPLSPERFLGRGYVPQAFTHGTLVCNDVNVNREFYTKVLGLEVQQLNDHVIYVKHPNTKRYIVCAERPEFKVHSPNFRNTLAVQSGEAVEEAYQWLSDSGHDLGVKELWPIENNGSVRSFFLRDPGTNCWEIASRN